MQPANVQKKQSKSKVAPVNTSAFTGRWGAAPQRDNYLTPKDQIWGDVIRHERVLETNWDETWIRHGEELVAESSRSETVTQKGNNNIQSTGKSLAFYRSKPSPGLPVKASGMVGWRASNPENSIEFFKTQYAPPKKRFVEEQYGYYRIMKYFTDGKKKDENPMPQKYVRPTIRRILC